MNRAEFMRQLQSLLSDISESEREEALSYYKSYFDDAGEENESNVIQELGSPGKVAAIIKSDLEDGSENYGEYTERGYEDTRGKEQNSPEIYGKQGSSGDGRQSRAERGYQPKGKKNSPGDLVLLIVILVFAAPIVLAVGGSILAVIASVILALLSGAAAVGLAALAGALAGVVMVAIGVTQCFISPGLGLLSVGAGLLVLGVSLLLILAFLWVGVRFLPWLIRKITDFCRKLLQKGKRRGGAAV